MIGLALAGTLLLAQSTPTPSASPTPSPNAILFRALNRLRSYGTPPFVVYLATENGETRRIAFRGADAMMNDSPYVPGRTTLPAARIYRAFVGPLAYSVHAALATPTPGAAATHPTPGPVAPNDLEATLKTIAIVAAHGRLYDVHVAGTERIGDRETYRVELHPLRDPERNDMRAFWVDTSTYDIVRAQYVYPDPPDLDMPGSYADLTVAFATVGRYRIAARWIAVYHGPDLREPFYRMLEVTRMTFPAELPSWFFDGSYAAHERAGEPDPLAGLFTP
ncbi:MAG: hypothetical protein KGN02_06940 [bacterium]|nr:hypothetical protein [bacterium]